MTGDPAVVLTAVVCAGLAASTAALVWPAPPAYPSVPRATPLGEPPDGPGTRSVATLRAVASVAAALAVLAVVTGWSGVVIAPLAAAAVWWRSATWQGASERRREEHLAAAVPHAVDLLAAALAAGAAPPDALRRVAEVLGGPVAEELRGPLTRLALGADPVRVWEELSSHPQLGRVGRALARATESGAPVVDALTRLAQELRAVRRAEIEAHVRQVEVKAAAPLAACLLPAFVLIGVVPLVAGAVSGLVLR